MAALRGDAERIIDQLKLKGILTAERDKTVIFSDLFAAYVSYQESPWEQQMYLDNLTRQVWVSGQPTPMLTAQEYRIFQLLYQHPNQVMTKDELISAGWPEAKGGVSTEALAVTFSRLRRKIENPGSTHQFIENVREQGYKLSIKK